MKKKKFSILSILLFLISVTILTFLVLNKVNLLRIEDLQLKRELSLLQFIFIITFLSLADSINPCIISLLTIMIATLASMKLERREIIIRAVVFTFVVFTTYFFLGLLMYFGFSFIYAASIAANIFEYVKIIIAAVLIFSGIINLRDAILKKNSIFSVPKKAKGLIYKLLTYTSLSATIFLAVLVTMVELPCTGLFYMGLVSFLHSLRESIFITTLILLYYNLIFVLPEILIVLLVYKGLEPRGIYEKIYKKNRYIMRMVEGLALIALGIFIWLFLRAV